MTENELIEIERYKKQIDEDFKMFPLTKRFIQLERSWIRDLSHKIMPKEKYFIHNDRKELRKKLLDYLNNKKRESLFPKKKK